MISAVVVGKDEVALRLRSLPPAVDEELRRTVQALAFDLVGYIKKNKLSGTVLKNRTGILRGSIHETMQFGEGKVFAQVGTNKEYAAVHEYGFDGVVTVREHLRMQVKVFGKAMKEPKSVTVRSHSMHMRMPERSYLRSSLQENAGEIRAKIAAALKRIAVNA